MYVNFAQNKKFSPLLSLCENIMKKSSHENSFLYDFFSNYYWERVSKYFNNLGENFELNGVLCFNSGNVFSFFNYQILDEDFLKNFLEGDKSTIEIEFKNSISSITLIKRDNFRCFQINTNVYSKNFSLFLGSEVIRFLKKNRFLIVIKNVLNLDGIINTYYANVSYSAVQNNYCIDYSSFNEIESKEDVYSNIFFSKNYDTLIFSKIQGIEKLIVENSRPFTCQGVWL